MRNALILGVIAFCLMLAGCGDSENSPEKGTLMTKEQLAILCTDKPWQLQKMVKANQQLKLLETAPITFACDPQGNVTGMASINRYSGAFTFDDEAKLNWRGAGFITTKMGGPPELMQQEQDFLETLGNTSQGRVEGSTLILESADKTDVLEFSQNTESK